MSVYLYLYLCTSYSCGLRKCWCKITERCIRTVNSQTSTVEKVIHYTQLIEPLKWFVFFANSSQEINNLLNKESERDRERESELLHAPEMKNFEGGETLLRQPAHFSYCHHPHAALYCRCSPDQRWTLPQRAQQQSTGSPPASLPWIKIYFFFFFWIPLREKTTVQFRVLSDKLKPAQRKDFFIFFYFLICSFEGDIFSKSSSLWWSVNEAEAELSLGRVFFSPTQTSTWRRRQSSSE